MTRITGDLGLQQAIDATEYLINDAFELCADGSVDKAVLEYLERPEFGGGELARKRFGTFYDSRSPATIKEYINVWSRILAYIWRTFDEDPANRPPYSISEQQCMAFEAFRERARDEAKGKSRTARAMKTECDQPTFLLGVALDLEQCMRLAADFWISIFNDSTPEDHNENLLMSGLAVVSIKDDHTLAGPIESLPKLEALINVGKALVVRKAKSERD